MNITPETLGKDELSPGLPFLRFFAPTEFDAALDAMIKYIRSQLSWDWINPTHYRLVGIDGGPIRKFLTRYIEIASAWRESYDPLFRIKWENEFKRKYGYDEETLGVYFNAFETLEASGRIPENVFRPFEYEAETGGVIGESFKTAGKSVMNYAILAAAIYAGILVLPRLLRKRA